VLASSMYLKKVKVQTYR
jgi:hypothetical protein